MEKEITVFRVRTEFNDIQSQKGAFLLFENAVKCAKNTGCNVYDGEGKCLWRNIKKANLRKK